MRKISLALISIAILMFLPIIAEAQLTDLTVTVQGLDPATGSVEVTLFNTAESFMKEPFIQQSQEVDGKEELIFGFFGLLEDNYAVVVVHDENGNGVLDNGFLGFGGESFAYSNNASPLWGRPSFDDVQISVGQSDVKIEIMLD